MRVDPRKACHNNEERKIWALLHDAFAHPYFFLYPGHEQSLLKGLKQVKQYETA